MRLWAAEPNEPSSRRWRALAAGLMLLGSMVIGVTDVSSKPAAAAPSAVGTTATLGDGVEGLDPNRTTPVEAEVWAIEEVGGVMLVGGAFLRVRDRSGFERIERPYLAAFDPSTGEYVPWFQTQPDGPVYDIVDLGNGRAVIAGEFRSVNGVAGTENLAVIDVATGEVDTRYQFRFSAATESVVRAVAVLGDDLYVTGNFTTMNVGGVRGTGSGLAKISLATRRLDASFSATLQGGGGWAIGADPATRRVVVGGRFVSVNNAAGTGTLAALAPNGALVNGWNHGFPHDACNQQYKSCGAVNGLAITHGRVFVAGAKHFWAALDMADGRILADKDLTNDGQSVDVVDGQIVIGCHCETGTISTEFNNVPHRYIRVIDPVSLTEQASPTVNSRGAAGGWAAGGASDGCLWVGGNLSSTFVSGTRHPAWNLLRFCPPGVGQNAPLTAPPANDTTTPSVPGTPVIDGQAGSTVTLSWASSADDGQVVYLIYRNGVLVGRSPTATYVDRLLGYDTTYNWQVAALDMAGNLTELSSRSQPLRIGPRVNIAPRGSATQSGDFDATTGASLAIDGNTSGDASDKSISRTGTKAQLDDGIPWWGLDLGRRYDVDSIELHPRRDSAFRESNNRPRVFRSTEPITVTDLDDGTGLRLWVGDVVRGNGSPRVDRVPIVEPVRYLRLFVVSSRVSFAEVMVFTSFPQPTPAQLPQDTVDPSAPRWSRTTTSGGVTTLRWGGQRDDVGVAYFEVYRDGALVKRTSDYSLAVETGRLAREFEVVAFDAAGNASGPVPRPGTSGVPACTFSRDGGSISVEWEAADSDEYVVKRRVNGSPWYWRGRVGGGATTFTDTDRPGVIEYQVVPRPAAGIEPTICGAEGGTPAPGDPKVTRIERRKIVLNYGGNGVPVEVERDGEIVGTEHDDWFVDSGLDPGATYRYRVRFAPDGEWSDVVSVTTKS